MDGIRRLGGNMKLTKIEKFMISEALNCFEGNFEDLDDMINHGYSRDDIREYLKAKMKILGFAGWEEVSS